MSLGRTLHRLSHLGVGARTPPSDAKYVTLINSVAMAGLFVSLFYLVVNLFLGGSPWSKFGPPTVSAAIFALPLWLNHRKRYWAATTSMCLVSIPFHLANVLTFGYAGGNQFFLLPTLGGIALAYPARHWKTAAFFVMVTLVIFTGIVLWGDSIRPRSALETETLQTYHSLALITTALLVVFITTYAHRRTVIAERQLEERSHELAETLRDLKAAQAQMIEAENQAVLGRLMAGLLHEINTPVGSVRSAANTVRVAVSRCRSFVAEHAERDAPGGAAALRAIDVSSELCDSIDQGTVRVSSVVESLRHFVGLDEAERKLFDVREGIDGAVAVLGPVLGDRIEVVRTYPETLSSVLGYPAKLNRAFLSVLQNSIQAIEDRGEIRVTVHERGGRIEVEMTDDGKGIAAEAMQELFEIGLTRKAGRVGMRLGLPLSKRSVEEIGGRLVVDSVEGRGTTVRVTLPVAVG